MPLIPTNCFTCGKPIGHLYTNFLEMVKEKKQENVQLPEDVPTVEILVLRELKIHRLCCKRMFLCHQDMYNLVR